MVVVINHPRVFRHRANYNDINTFRFGPSNAGGWLSRRLKTMKLATRTITFALGAVIGLGAAPPPAQEAKPGGQGRAVARLSLLNGDVSVRRGDSGDWVAGAVNAPLLAGDRILATGGSRAEVQFDHYHRIRLAGDTEIRLPELETRRYQIQVASGTVTFSAMQGGDAQVEISTRSAAVRPIAHGVYRVTVLPDGAADITVREGEAEIFTPTGSHKIRPGRTMKVRLDDAGQSEFQLLSAIPRDAWDEFNERRDKDLRSSTSYQYLSRDIYGAEDLDGFGNWVNIPPYGWCWRPMVAAGWAPYRFGRWSWLDWFGWTWMSMDPWGWAPFHFGRWFHWGGLWHWHPGAMWAPHVWQPALVAFIGWNAWGGMNFGPGFGGGFGLGLGGGFGHWGWVPLAPFEPFHPWFGHHWYGGFRHGTFIDNSVRIANNVNITDMYRNARIGNGVTVVRGEDFARGRVGEAMRAGGSELARGSLMQGALPIAPQRESLRFSDREGRSPQGIANLGGGAYDRFYSRRTVSPIERVPFEQQQRTLESWSRRGDYATEGIRGGGAGRQSEYPRGETPRWGDTGRSGAGDYGGYRSGESGREALGGWRRTGDETRSVDIGRGETGRTQYGGDGGWRRFGDPTGGVRVSGDESGRAGRVSDLSPRTGGSEYYNESRTGWRPFGDPARGTAREGYSSGGRTSYPGGDTGAWNTRGGTGRTNTPGYGASRSETPGGRMPQILNGSGPIRSDSPRTADPGYGSPRGRGTDSPGWGSNGRGPDGAYSNAPMAPSGRWSTGGGEASGRRSGDYGGGAWSSGRTEAPSPMRGGEWSTGGTARGEARGGAGSWSTRDGSGGYNTPRSGSYGSQPGGYNSPRGGDYGYGSRSGGGYSSPGTGGSSSPGTGGYGAPRSGDYGGRGSINAPGARGAYGGSSGGYGGSTGAYGGTRGGYGGTSGGYGGLRGGYGGASGSYGGMRGGYGGGYGGGGYGGGARGGGGR
jgi:hypothetical protein